MRRTLILLVLAVGAGYLWWEREGAQKLVAERAPFLANLMERRPRRPPPSRRVVEHRSPVPVVVAPAARKDIPLTIEGIGTVQAIASIAIKPRIDSQIVSIAVAEGARVKQGDLLVTLDQRALKAQLAQADAQLAKARAQLVQLRRDLARYDELLAKRIGTEVQRDTALTAFRVGEAQIAADEAARSNLETSLSFTELRAPVSGRIGSIPLKVGTTVRSADAQAILTVNQVDPIYIGFAVPQTSFPELRAALAAGPVQVNAKTASGNATGTVAFVENTVDLATGTVLAKALMPNADEKLWPGSFVSVSVSLGVEPGVVAIPSSAVQIGQQGSYVFVVGQGGKAELRNVSITRTVGAESVIGRGLTGNESVVIDGQLRLVNGGQVQIQTTRTGESSPSIAVPERS
jgi:multidrug efflux system membrane fusion protein